MMRVFALCSMAFALACPIASIFLGEGDDIRWAVGMVVGITVAMFLFIVSTVESSSLEADSKRIPQPDK